MSEHDAAPQPWSRVDGLGGGPHRGHAPPEVRNSTAHYLEPESGLVEARGETGHARRPVSPRLLLRLKGTILGVFAEKKARPRKRPLGSTWMLPPLTSVPGWTAP